LTESHTNFATKLTQWIHLLSDVWNTANIP